MYLGGYMYSVSYHRKSLEKFVMFTTQRGGKAVVENSISGMHLMRDKYMKIEQTCGGGFLFPLASTKPRNERSTRDLVSLSGVEKA